MAEPANGQPASDEAKVRQLFNEFRDRHASSALDQFVDEFSRGTKSDLENLRQLALTAPRSHLANSIKIFMSDEKDRPPFEADSVCLQLWDLAAIFWLREKFDAASLSAAPLRSIFQAVYRSGIFSEPLYSFLHPRDGRAPRLSPIRHDEWHKHPIYWGNVPFDVVISGDIGRFVETDTKKLIMVPLPGAPRSSSPPTLDEWVNHPADGKSLIDLFLFRAVHEDGKWRLDLLPILFSVSFVGSYRIGEAFALSPITTTPRYETQGKSGHQTVANFEKFVPSVLFPEMFGVSPTKPIWEPLAPRQSGAEPICLAWTKDYFVKLANALMRENTKGKSR